MIAFYYDKESEKTSHLMERMFLLQNSDKE